MLSRIELYDSVDEMLAEDPRVALFAIRRMLDEEIPWLELRAVRRARSHRTPWSTIGRALGRSRQAVQQRYADLDRQWVPIPHRPLPLADQLDRERRQVLRHPTPARARRRRGCGGLVSARWPADGPRRTGVAMGGVPGGPETKTAKRNVN